MASLKDKVVLITGASSGIGEATAIHFASLGSRVVLNGRDMENLTKAAEKCETTGLDKDKILIAQGDISKQDEANHIVDKAVETFGQLDVLVNNAGVVVKKKFQESTIKEYDEIMDTNLKGLIMVTQRATPHLIKTKGNIINISSIAGTRPLSVFAFYALSKAAVDHLTGILAQDLGPHGVRVNSVNPGTIDTGILIKCGVSQEAMEQYNQEQKYIHPIGRIGEVDEVAKVIAFLASDDASFVNGAIVPVDGGRLHISPSAAKGPVM